MTLKEHIEKIKTNKNIKIEGFLNIVLEKGDDLVPMDVSGKSDPYVLFAVGPSPDVTKVYPKTAKSKVKKQTLFPVFNEEFNLPITSISKDYLLIEVWDWDLIGSDDFMGSADITLSTIKALSENRKAQIQLKLQKVKSGTITLTLSYHLVGENVSTMSMVKSYLSQHEFNIPLLINNFSTKFIYKEYLRDHDLSDQFTFLEKVMQYRLMDSSQRHIEAEKIVNSFIRSDAVNQVSIPTHMRNDIISDSTTNTSQELFDPAFDHEVKIIMEQAPTDKFVQSQAFLSVLADNVYLIHEISTTKNETTLANALSADSTEEAVEKLRREISGMKV